MRWRYLASSAALILWLLRLTIKREWVGFQSKGIIHRPRKPHRRFVACINKTEENSTGSRFQKAAIHIVHGNVSACYRLSVQGNGPYGSALPWNTLLLIIIHQHFPLNLLFHPRHTEKCTHSSTSPFPSNKSINNVHVVNRYSRLVLAAYSTSDHSPFPLHISFIPEVLCFGLGKKILPANNHSK